VKYITSPIFWIALAALVNAAVAIFTLRAQDRQTEELRG
jgi:hypothetical protein